jgi:hypothetical protein
MKLLLLIWLIVSGVNYADNPCPPIPTPFYCPSAPIEAMMNDSSYQYVYTGNVKAQRKYKHAYLNLDTGECEPLEDEIFTMTCAGIVTGGHSAGGGYQSPWARSNFPASGGGALIIGYPECDASGCGYQYPLASTYDTLFPKGEISSDVQNMICNLWAKPDFKIYREHIKSRNISCILSMPFAGPYHEIELKEDIDYSLGKAEGPTQNVRLKIHGDDTAPSTGYTVPHVTAHRIQIGEGVLIQNITVAAANAYGTRYISAASEYPQTRPLVPGTVQFITAGSSTRNLRIRDVNIEDFILEEGQHIGDSELAKRFNINNPQQRELDIRGAQDFTVHNFSLIKMYYILQNATFGNPFIGNYIENLSTYQSASIIAKISQNPDNTIFFRMENLGSKVEPATIDTLLLRGEGEANFKNSYVSIKNLKISSDITITDSHNLTIQNIDGEGATGMATDVHIHSFIVNPKAHGDTEIKNFGRILIGDDEFAPSGTIRFYNIDELEIRGTEKILEIKTLLVSSLADLNPEYEDGNDDSTPERRNFLQNYTINQDGDEIKVYKIRHSSGEMEFYNVRKATIWKVQVISLPKTDTVVRRRETDRLTTVKFQPEPQTFINEGVFTNEIHDIKMETIEHELFFGRAYNSNGVSFGPMGAKWELPGQYRLFPFDEEDGESQRLEVSWGQGTATSLFAVGDSYVSTDGRYNAEFTPDNESIFLTRNDGTTYVFNNKPIQDSPLAENFIIDRVTGPGNYDLLYEYDEQTRLTRMGEVPKGSGNINQENPALEITYNQNNLIDCVYAAGQETHCYDYDDGRLTGVSTPDSGYKERYAYKDETKPALLSDLLDKDAENIGIVEYDSQGQAVSYTTPGDIPQTLPTTITLLLDNEPLGEGHSVAVFDINGEYLDHAEDTDAASQAVFQLEVGIYSFTYTYNDVEFQSHQISAGEEATINIPAPTTVTVLLGSEPIGAGLTVYPFKAEGGYVGYTKTTDENSRAYFNLPEGNYIFRYTYEGVEFSSDETAAFTETTITVPLTKVQVWLGEESFTAESLSIQVFSEAGEFLELSENTDETGAAYFNLDPGNYKFFCTYSQRQYWSETSAAFEQADIFIPAPTTVTVFFNDVPAGSGLQIQAFPTSGFPMNYLVMTNAQSEATFHLPNGNYKFLCTYGNQSFWSDIIETPSQAEIHIFPTSVTLFQGAELFTPAGQTIKAFTANGTDLNYSSNTNEQSIAHFILPEGNYKFLFVYDNTEYWSAEIPAFNQACITIPAQTTVNLTFNGEGIGNGFTIEAFSSDGTELGISAITDDDSTAHFTLPEGNYKFRHIHEGVTFWSSEIAATEYATINIQPTTVTVWRGESLLATTLDIQAFTADETDLDYVVTTNEESVATFILPEGNYKFLCIYEGVAFWSAAIAATEQTTINIQPTTVTVWRGESLLATTIDIQAFTADETDLDYTVTTNEESVATFILPEGNYKFLCIYDGILYWSAETAAFAEANIHLPITSTDIFIRRLGEPFTQPVTMEAFREGEPELIYSKITDENGMASFTLSAGFYNFRMEIEGIEHWLSGVDAGEIRNFPTRHTRTILRRDGESLNPGQSCRLLINWQESGGPLYTDENSAIVSLPAEDYFRLRCDRQTGGTAVTDMIQVGSEKEFDFIRQVVYQLHYPGIKPTDYNEQLCFDSTDSGIENCIDPQENATSVEAGGYEIVYRLGNQHYVLDSVTMVMSAEPEEFTLTLPEIRQISLTNNDIPQTETELRLVRDGLEFPTITNNNGHLFFVRSGEWQIFLDSVQLGIITAEQDFVHFNTETAEGIPNIETPEDNILFNPDDYEEEISNAEVPLVLLPEMTSLILNPTQLFYQTPDKTIFNIPALSLPIYSTANAELKFTLYKLPTHYTMTEPQVLQTFIFQINSGDNEFNWSLKDENNLFYDPGDYYLLIEANNGQEIDFMSYNEALQLKPCSTIDFTIAY